MKKLLATTAVLTVAMAGAASAQSVLERVLSQTASLNQVTGVFANVADNIGAGNQLTEEPRLLAAGDTIFLGLDGTDAVYGTVNADGTITATNTTTNVTAGQTVLQNAGALTTTAGAGVSAVNAPIGSALGRSNQGIGLLTSATPGITALTGGNAITLATFGTGTIDGSIEIISTRVNDATANVEDTVTAIEGVTTNFGSMATTVLGAVNTGEIALGTNQEVEEAVAGASEAVRSVVNQVGTNTGETVLALNSALNTMNIDGSIGITLNGVNASVASISPDQLDILSDGGVLTVSGVGELLGSMETTVLGAVNTGTIVSGVNNQISGTVAGIVGNSAENTFAN